MKESKLESIFEKTILSLVLIAAIPMAAYELYRVFTKKEESQYNTTDNYRSVH